MNSCLAPLLLKPPRLFFLHASPIILFKYAFLSCYVPLRYDPTKTPSFSSALSLFSHSLSKSFPSSPSIKPSLFAQANSRKRSLAIFCLGNLLFWEINATLPSWKIRATVPQSVLIPLFTVERTWFRRGSSVAFWELNITDLRFYCLHICMFWPTSTEANTKCQLSPLHILWDLLPRPEVRWSPKHVQSLPRPASFAAAAPVFYSEFWVISPDSRNGPNMLGRDSGGSALLLKAHFPRTSSAQPKIRISLMTVTHMTCTDHKYSAR